MPLPTRPLKFKLKYFQCQWLKLLQRTRKALAMCDQKQNSVRRYHCGIAGYSELWMPNLQNLPIWRRMHRLKKTRTDQENMLLPISRKRAFQESMAALEEGEDTEIEGDPIDEQPKPKNLAPKKLQKVEDKIEKKRRLKERTAALDEKFVDQGDQLIDVVRTMASKMGAGSENAKRLETVEAEVARVREVGEATAEKVNNSLPRLDQIFHLLQEMRNKAT